MSDRKLVSIVTRKKAADRARRFVWEEGDIEIQSSGREGADGKASRGKPTDKAETASATPRVVSRRVVKDGVEGREVLIGGERGGKGQGKAQGDTLVGSMGRPVSKATATDSASDGVDPEYTKSPTTKMYDYPAYIDTGVDSTFAELTEHMGKQIDTQNRLSKVNAGFSAAHSLIERMLAKEEGAVDLDGLLAELGTYIKGVVR